MGGAYKCIVTGQIIVDTSFWIPAAPLKKHHARRHRYVQGRNGSRHRNANQHVAMFLYQLMQTVSFPAQDEDRWFGVLDLAVELAATLVQSIDPKIAFLQIL